MQCLQACDYETKNCLCINNIFYELSDCMMITDLANSDNIFYQLSSYVIIMKYHTNTSKTWRSYLSDHLVSNFPILSVNFFISWSIMRWRSSTLTGRVWALVSDLTSWTSTIATALTFCLSESEGTEAIAVWRLFLQYRITMTTPTTTESTTITATADLERPLCEHSIQLSCRKLLCPPSHESVAQISQEPSPLR